MEKNKLPNVNIVAIGHIDHGKSTLIGRIIYDSGQLKPDRLEEIKSVLKKLNKEKFEYAFILDTFQEEREEAMTIDTVQVPFKSEKYLYNFIDCPGHKEFIKNMISGASYGEISMFVVSAKLSEGVQSQSKEHAWLAKEMGIDRLVVAVNKMDTVDYDKEIFYIISSDIKDMLESMGYVTENVQIVPVSAMEGDNVLKKSERMEWYDGPTLVEALDNFTIEPKNYADSPLRIPVQDSYEVGGERVIVGRVELGKVEVGDEVVVSPSGERGTVESIQMWNKEKVRAVAGENIGIKVIGISEIKRGYVFSSGKDVPNVSKEFSAEIFILEDDGEVVEGRDYIIRCGTANVQCKAEKIINKMDPRSGKVSGGKVKVLSMDDAGTVKFVATEPFVIEKQTETPQLGRILIRDSGVTIAVGVVKETN